jgi:hypothetical protein
MHTVTYLLVTARLPRCQIALSGFQPEHIRACYTEQSCVLRRSTSILVPYLLFHRHHIPNCRLLLRPFHRRPFLHTPHHRPQTAQLLGQHHSACAPSPKALHASSRLPWISSPHLSVPWSSSIMSPFVSWMVVEQYVMEVRLFVSALGSLCSDGVLSIRWRSIRSSKDLYQFGMYVSVMTPHMETLTHRFQDKPGPKPCG